MIRAVPRSHSVAALVAAGLAVMTSSPTAAQLMLICNTTCTGAVGAGMTCMVTVMCPPAYSSCMGHPASYEFAGVAGNCVINLGANDASATAMHSAGQGVPNDCDVTFGRFCGTFSSCAFGTSANAVCLMDASDGLPVELMSFTFEPQETESPPQSQDPEPSRD